MTTLPLLSSALSFRFCHLITAYLSQEKFGPSRLSALIMEWSERLVRFSFALFDSRY